MCVADEVAGNKTLIKVINIRTLKKQLPLTFFRK
jgi:hypothetical protein